MKKVLALLLVAVTLPCAALGQTKDAKPREPLRLGLAECVRRALANSRTLMSERHRLAALDAQVEQAFWAQFSDFSAEGFFSVVPDKCIDEDYYDSMGVVRNCSDAGGKGYSGLSEDSYDATKWGPTIQLKVEGGVPIYTFGKISNARDAIQEAYKAKEAEIPAFEDKVRFQVEQAYEAVSGAREMLYSIGEGRAHLVKAREKVEADLAAQEGTATEVDLLKLKVFEGEVDGIEVQ
ncbi:MAG: TolC family protein, partial [Deltaproteobacteria bacterium]|nr:TolC family protein [Deltaproteobacteria bacterium]